MSDIEPLKKASSSIEYMDQAERCVRRMSYKLSVSQGTNREIADAAVMSCDGEIGAVAASYARIGEMPSAAQLKQMSEITAADRDDYKKSALMWVIQSRAGHCASMFVAGK